MRLPRIATRKAARSACAVAIFAAIGLFTLSNSSASTFVAASEAETGTVAGAATKKADAAASDGQSVMFDHKNRPIKGLWSYPPAYRDTSNKLWPGLVAANKAQMTTLVPGQDRIDGVMLLLYWSVLEPQPGVYRWDIIDEAVNYWRAKGKRVALNPANYGPPVQFGPELGGQVENGLPEWLRSQIQTLPAYHEEPLGAIGGPTYPVYTPVPWDPVFKAKYTGFIKQLADRYDGNPGIAYVRIGTGHIGEETYPYFCGAASKRPPELCQAAVAAGWTPRKWYDSTLWMATAYRNNFVRTDLSLNLGLTGFFYNAQLPDFQHKAEAKRLVDYCVANDIMLGNNGLREASLAQIRDGQAQNSAIGHLLKELSDSGHPVEYEAFAPLDNEQMANTTAIAQAIQLTRPQYLNMFGTMYAAEDYLLGDRSPAALNSWNRLTLKLGPDGAKERAEAWSRLLAPYEL